NSSSVALAPGPGTFGNTSPAGTSCFLLLAMGGITSAAGPYFSDIFGKYQFSTLYSATRTNVVNVNSAASDEAGTIETTVEESRIAGSLNQQELSSIVSAAIQNWSATGLTPQQISSLRAIQFEVADLKDAYLG